MDKNTSLHVNYRLLFDEFFTIFATDPTVDAAAAALAACRRVVMIGSKGGCSNNIKWTINPELMQL